MNVYNVDKRPNNYIWILNNEKKKNNNNYIIYLHISKLMFLLHKSYHEID